MNQTLDHIEARLQNLIENSADLLPWRDRTGLLAQKLVRSMQTYFNQQVSTEQTIPHAYTIYLHPDSIAALPASSHWLDALSEALMESAGENNLNFTEPPLIQLAANPNLSLGEIEVTASSPRAGVGSTAVAPSSQSIAEANSSQIPANAFLILEDNTTFILNSPVINIGRREDNQLVLKDARISRTHAQIRVSRGVYIIFDLNSTSGTYINGRRITQATLMTGDVISIAGVNLVYGQELPPSSGNTDNQAVPPKPDAPEVLS
jgi:pSer/pThr/pTyr-binding forkhead associated (FHA) protein